MKLIKLRFLLFLLICLISTIANGQSTLSFADGTSVMESDYSNVLGSPYLIDEWREGSVILISGKVFQKISLKYSEKDDEVYFKNEKNEPMSFNEKVRSFTLKEDDKLHLYQNGYPDGLGITNKSYLDVLAQGKTAEFLKRSSKSVIDSKDYASAVINRRFMEVIKYYLFLSSKMYVVKKDQKSILSVFTNDKQEELLKFIKDNNLNLKNEIDIVKVINYYNYITG